MIDHKISKELLRRFNDSSDGTQLKYYDGEYWYKVNQNGYEGYAEFLVSLVLKYSNIESFAVYEECKINGINGCRSKSFLKKDEQLMTFNEFYDIYYGGNLSDRIYFFRTVQERVRFLINVIYESLNLDATTYLSTILYLDMLTLNDDRHFGNLAFVQSKKGIEFSPIFDNGSALLSSFKKFSNFDSIPECIEQVVGAPFSGDLELQALALENHLKIDYKGLYTALDTVRDLRGKAVLLYQLDRYKDIFNDNITHTIHAF